MHKRLKDLRTDHDYSQNWIANYLGMSQTGYSKYETGEVAPPVHVLINLAMLYKTSTDYILGLTDNPAPPKK